MRDAALRRSPVLPGRARVADLCAAQFESRANDFYGCHEAEVKNRWFEAPDTCLDLFEIREVCERHWHDHVRSEPEARSNTDYNRSPPQRNVLEISDRPTHESPRMLERDAREFWIKEGSVRDVRFDQPCDRGLADSESAVE
jgi:hypothetical protein